MAAVEAGIARFVWAATRLVATGQLKFAGPAILNPPQALKAAWRERMAALAVAKPPVARVEAGHGSVASARAKGTGEASQAKGALRYATGKQPITN